MSEEGSTAMEVEPEGTTTEEQPTAVEEAPADAAQGESQVSSHTHHFSFCIRYHSTRVLWTHNFHVTGREDEGPFRRLRR